MPFSDSTFQMILVVAGLAFLPLLAIAVTSFTKISVVFFIVRNALGIQQLPPNIVVYSLSLILSAYIFMPVMNDAFQAANEQGRNYKTIADWERAGKAAIDPVKSFLDKHSDPERIQFFVAATAKIWSSKSGLTASKSDLTILVPAFLLTQLTQAFEMGFLLYLPFMAIDIIVTAILMALGMMMIPPNSIAIPFKLMLFVFIDGWTKIIQGLILSYS